VDEKTIQRDRFFKLALTKIEGVGPILAKHLMSYCDGLAENIFKTPAGKLLKIPGIGQKTVESLKSNQTAFKFAEEELLKLEALKDVELIFYNEPAYPKRLKRFADSPFRLYQKGNYNSASSKSIAIVGTRRATEYGKWVVNELVRYLSTFDDILVVSGLAYGIDIAAHKACIEFAVPNLAVMANGIDSVYPPQHQSVSEKICNKGALLTENEIGALPEAAKFPQRNRVIAAMSDAVVVVEAAHKGGALITAEIANDYGVEVFAVPGNLNQPFSMGCNSLIEKQLALPLVRFDQIPQQLNWDGLIEVAKKEDTLLMPNDLDEEEKLIYAELMKSGVLEIDVISIRTGLAVSKLASLLTLMEFRGILSSAPGKRFKIK
jgi:DNA processing protein